MQVNFLKIQVGLVGIATLGLVTIASASPAMTAQPDLTTTNWIVNWDISNCQLMRAGPNNPVALKIQHHPAAETVAITIGNKSWNDEPSNGAKELDVVLLPSGNKFTGRSFSGRADKGAVLTVGEIGDSFLAKLNTSNAIAIEVAGKRLIEMSFPTAAAATEQLRRCSDDLLADWGMDTAAMAALKQKAAPLTEPRSVFSVGDYPAAALRAGIQGVVIARLDIDQDGKITDCVAMEPKPDWLLINATCNALRRVKYRPAIGADDRPVPSRMMVPPITWSLPRSR